MEYLEPTDVIIPLDCSLEEAKRKFIWEVIKKYQFNKTHAAKSLRISVRTLQRWIKVDTRKTNEMPSQRKWKEM